jgi:hypothetical protein
MAYRGVAAAGGAGGVGVGSSLSAINDGKRASWQHQRRKQAAWRRLAAGVSGGGIESGNGVTLAS